VDNTPGMVYAVVYDPSAAEVPEPICAPLNLTMNATFGAILPEIVVVIPTGPAGGTHKT
jgi:hypothetical protein